jgi:signal transduction histidine kinase
VAAALYAAFRTPGNFGLTTMRGAGIQPVVSWIAPASPAWATDIVPGDTIMAGPVPSELVVRGAGHKPVILRAGTLTPTPASLLDTVLGLCLLALGAVVLARGRDRAASRAYWRMSLCASAALGLVPAGVHGVTWALALDFIALMLFGPALLDLTLAFPGPPPSARRRALLWLPALALVLFYPLFPLAQVAGELALGVYILTAGVRIIYALVRPHSPQQRAQAQALALGLVGGLLPLIVLTLLPEILIRRILVPGDISILALALLPLSVGVAVVRDEFLGVTSLVRRRTLRLALGLALLGVAAALAWAAASIGPERWGWPSPLIAAAIGVLAALGYTPLRRALTRGAERVFLRDAYDTAGTLLQLSVELSESSPGEAGSLIVARLGAVLDLSFALLVTEQGQDYHAHPRAAIPPALYQATVERAHALRAEPPCATAFVERVRRLPVLFLPVRDGRDVVAVLCLGPKRSGDRYTAQDRTLLGALGRHLAVLMHNERLRAQVDRQVALLRKVAQEKADLAERALHAAEEERQRLAGALHDEAIQMGGEVTRRLDGLLALPHLPLDVHLGVSEATALGGDLVARLRALAGELYPPPLQTAGLPPALRALLRDSEREGRGSTTCLLDVDPAFGNARLPHEHEVILYRVARETVGNAVRHARDATIHVSLRLDGDDVCLSVRDDGDGFTMQPIGALLASGHLGLALLQQRAHRGDLSQPPLQENGRGQPRGGGGPRATGRLAHAGAGRGSRQRRLTGAAIP